MNHHPIRRQRAGYDREMKIPMRSSLIGALLGVATAMLVPRLRARRSRHTHKHQSETPAEYERAGTRILVLGGGFGGVKTVLELDRRLHNRPNIATLLVSRETGELFVPLLWTLADGRSGANHVTVPLRSLQKGRTFHVLNAEVTAIDLDRRVVETTVGPRSYDTLVIALGSVTSMPPIPGLREYAHRFRSPADALQLRNQIVNAVEGAHTITDAKEREALLTFVVAGGGDTGTELAAAINDFLRNTLAHQYPWLFDVPPRVAIVERAKRILPLASADVAMRVQRALEASGIELYTGAAIERVTSNAVYAGDTVIPACNVFWAAGVNAPDVVRALPVPHAPNGAVIVNNHLRIPNYPNVYVIGDAAWANDGVTGRPVPALAQAAEHEARYVARAIVAELDAKPLPPFHFTKLGEMTLLGKRNAVAEIGPFVVTGEPAWLLWHAYYLSHIGSWRNRLLLAADWTLAAALGPETGELRLADYPRN